jgi:hypothetical protein
MLLYHIMVEEITIYRLFGYTTDIITVVMCNYIIHTYQSMVHHARVHALRIVYIHIYKE